MISTRPLRDDERAWAAELIGSRWGDEVVVARGRVHRPAELDGVVAEADGERAGLATFRVDGADCEVVTIDALVEGHGIGTALLEATAAAARRRGCARLWLITTNDNLRALRFYQRRGFALAALHRDAVAQSRRLKPSISLVGDHGIPIRDELELELRLTV